MMLSDDHLRHLVPMPPSPCGCAPRPWPRPVVPVPVTPQMQPHWAEELRRILDGKQDAISDLDDIREGAQAGATAYQKPEDGVPKADLAAGVQASLDLADTALQEHQDISGKAEKSEMSVSESGDRTTIQLKSGTSATVLNAHQDISGKADLVGGKVPSSQLPSYVDDVIEVANYAALPATGEGGKIYVTLDTNKTYRWSGSGYIEISNPTLDDAVTRTSANGVKSSGIWSALWGALSALPTGFSSLYDWCVAQLAGKQPSLTAGRIVVPGVIKSVSAAVKYQGSTQLLRLPTENFTINGKALSSDVTLTGADIAVSGADAMKIDTALAGKASTADATLTPIYSDTPTFSDWVFTPEQVTDPVGGVHRLKVSFSSMNSQWSLRFADRSGTITMVDGTLYDTSLRFPSSDYIPQQIVTATRTRTDIIGYTLGSQSDKPLASEAEAEALRTGKQNALSQSQLDNIAAVPSKANDADVVHRTGAETIAGTKTFTSNIIVSTGNKQVAYGRSIFISGGATIGFPANSGTLALTYDLRYALTTKTISNGAVTLDDRAINAVAVSSSLASLTVNFPTATSGKARDFGLRLTVASGIITAPQIVLPQGVTCENADGEAPEIGADGAATILYFTETASGVFLVKGEVLQTITA